MTQKFLYFFVYFPKHNRLSIGLHNKTPLFSSGVLHHIFTFYAKKSRVCCTFCSIAACNSSTESKAFSGRKNWCSST